VIVRPCDGPKAYLSGIQPTGRKHLGNYIGVIRHYVEGQGAVRIYCIVDLHAIVPQDLSELGAASRHGRDPDRRRARA
jgi:tryptophanyl-tRNA synthetase